MAMITTTIAEPYCPFVCGIVLPLKIFWDFFRISSFFSSSFRYLLCPVPDGSLDHGSRHGKHRGLYTDRIPAVHLYPHVIDTVASLRRCQTAVRTHNILRHVSGSISCRTGHAEIIENVFRIAAVYQIRPQSAGGINAGSGRGHPAGQVSRSSNAAL